MSKGQADVVARSSLARAPAFRIVLLATGSWFLVLFGMAVYLGRFLGAGLRGFEDGIILLIPGVVTFYLALIPPAIRLDSIGVTYTRWPLRRAIAWNTMKEVELRGFTDKASSTSSILFRSATKRIRAGKGFDWLELRRIAEFVDAIKNHYGFRVIQSASDDDR